MEIKNLSDSQLKTLIVKQQNKISDVNREIKTQKALLMSHKTKLKKLKEELNLRRYNSS